MHSAVCTALPLYEFLSEMKCQDRKITLLTLRIKCSSITANHSGNCIIKENIWNSDWLLAFGWRAVLKHPLHKYVCSGESLFCPHWTGRFSEWFERRLSRIHSKLRKPTILLDLRNKGVPKLFTEFVWIIGALEKSPGYPEMNCCNLQFTWTAVKQFTKYRIEKLAECLVLCPVLFIVLVVGASNCRERSSSLQCQRDHTALQPAYYDSLVWPDRASLPTLKAMRTDYWELSFHQYGVKGGISSRYWAGRNIDTRREHQTIEMYCLPLCIIRSASFHQPIFVSS